MRFLPLSLLTLTLAVSLTSCDLFGSDPAVNEVFLIGTRVTPDFATTGVFEIVATPLDDSGESILDSGVEAEVVLTAPTNAQTTVTFGQVNPVSNEPLSVTLTIDESGSMTSTDPQKLRVSGAKSFLQRLDQTPGLNWESAVFGYSSGSREIQTFSSDLTLLNTGLDGIRASGGTSTYGALDDVLDLYDAATSTLPASRPSARKAIVLFSDGQPGDSNQRPAVCARAISLRVPVYAIGLGPASDLSTDAQTLAVEEMRAIANCSRGAYAGIATNDPTAVQAIYVSIATAAAQGSLTYNVRLSGPGFTSLLPGQRVSGNLTLTNGGASASAPFQFTVPARSSARPAPVPADQ